VWRIGGMILHEEEWKYSNKTWPSATLSTGVVQDQTWASTLKGQ